MTRDEYRNACIEAMADAMKRNLFGLPLTGIDYWRCEAVAALDALHGIARVNPIEATDEMVTASGWSPHSHVKAGWLRMSATGDLTNPPEGKP